MKSTEDFANILTRVEFPGFRFRLHMDAQAALFMQVCFTGPCNRTGEIQGWKGRKWKLSGHMTDGEVVQTAFLAVTTALEHEARENFKYKGVSVFDPHYDIEALVALRKDPSSIKERDPAPIETTTENVAGLASSDGKG